jgi:[ribosomal protein S5]-alanine N-acetyltransferase
VRPIVVETARLLLREMTPEDAAFILKLVNDPAWIQFIGDKGIRTIDGARRYIIEGPMEMYAQLGFGLWLVEQKESRIPIGMCGLIKRPALDDVDVGFAFLPENRGQGYAFESASATIAHARKAFGLTKLSAITAPANNRSVRVLEKLGFKFERMIKLSPAAPKVSLYGTNSEIPVTDIGPA